ncbi:MAG: fibronectin type III domain-containing protein [Bacteriovoracaceae bacterium]
MHLKRADLLMGLIGLLLVVASSYQLMFSHRDSSKTGIALLEMIQQTVKTRQGSDLFWKTPSQGSAIQDNQLVFTAQGSSAKISFNNGNVIEVSENSLVRVSASNLNLVKGELSTRLSGKDLEIQVGDQTFKLKSDEAQVAIQKAGEKTLIGVVSGKVDVIDQDKKVIEASSTNIVEVGSKEVVVKKRLDITPQPLPMERFYTTRDRFEIIFGDYPGTIHISDSKEFKNPKVYRRGQTFAPGNYYWRVIADSQESLIFNFEIIKDTPPKLFRPLDESVFKLDLPESLNFQWEASEEEIEIEIYSGERIVFHEFIRGGLFQATIDAEGDYRWRARKKYPDYQDTTWSSWQNFKVFDLKKDIPTNLFPRDYEVQTYDLESEKVEFSWNYPGEVIVSIRHHMGRTKTFKARDRFIWNISDEGEFFVKVKAADNPLDQWSPESRVWVKDLSKEKNLEVYTVELSRPDQDVNFSWSGSEGEYLFELSRSQDFKDIILSKKVRDPGLKVSIPEVGSYFWRSRILSDGKWKVSPPKRIIIKPTPAPEKPKSLPQLKVPLKLRKSTSLFSFIPRAIASEATFVSLKLPKHEEAKFYKLEIYRDENLKELLFTRTSVKNQITWEGARSGKFFYRYSIIDHWGRESEFSEASLLEVTSKHLMPGTPKDLKLTVKEKSVSVNWEKDNLASFYRIEIANNKDFTDPKVINSPENNYEFEVNSGRYFVRVKSFNDFGESKFEEKSFHISFKNNVLEEADKNQLFLLYRPSIDNMEFSDGETGKVKGEVLAATELRFERVDKYLSIIKADFVMGKVFEGESYQQYSIEGSLDYLIKNDEWKFSVGPVVKWWSLPIFTIENKVRAKSESQFTLGGHLRLGRNIGDHDIFFDQYVYATGVKGTLSELSYRRSLERFNLFTGLGFESIDFKDQKKNGLILKLGIGLSF